MQLKAIHAKKLLKVLGKVDTTEKNLESRLPVKLTSSHNVS
jgi:hypothetical protein